MTNQVELVLEPGSEVESCLMAGRGMNGKKGVVVWYEPKLNRYHVDFDDGNVMTLQRRNVRVRKVRGVGVEGGDVKSDETHGDILLPPIEMPPAAPPLHRPRLKKKKKSWTLPLFKTFGPLGRLSSGIALLLMAAAYVYTNNIYKGGSVGVGGSNSSTVDGEEYAVVKYSYDVSTSEENAYDDDYNDVDL